MPTRCRSPAERCPGSSRSLARRPTLESAARTRRPVSRCRSPAARSGTATFSNTLRSGSRCGSCHTTPRRERYCGKWRLAKRPTSAPFTSTRPRVARSAHSTSFRNVLLPAPEWPLRNTIEPSPMASETPRSASAPFSKRLPTCWNSISATVRAPCLGLVAVPAASTPPRSRARNGLSPRAPRQHPGRRRDPLPFFAACLPPSHTQHPPPWPNACRA